MATYLFQNETQKNKVLSVTNGAALEVHQMGNLSPIESTPTKEIVVEGYFAVGMGENGFSIRDEGSGKTFGISVVETWEAGDNTVIRATVLTP